MWTEEIEQLLKELSTKAQLWALLHADSQRYYDRQSRWLKIPQVVLSSISTSSCVVTLATSNQLILIFTLITQLIVTILAAVTLFLQVVELAVQHGKSEELASKLAEEIAVQLALPEDERMDAKQFIIKVRTTLDTVRNKPPVVDSIIARYSKIFDSQQQQLLATTSQTPPRPPTAEFFEDAAEVKTTTPITRTQPDIERVERAQLSQLHQFQLQRLNALLLNSQKPLPKA